MFRENVGINIQKEIDITTQEGMLVHPGGEAPEVSSRVTPPPAGLRVARGAKHILRYLVRRRSVPRGLQGPSHHH